jgi:hypothetical protein
MDLNHLYSEHQISLMRAAQALSEPTRHKHLSAAGVIGIQIFNLLSSKNARASADWRSWTSRPCQTADLVVQA